MVKRDNDVDVNEQQQRIRRYLDGTAAPAERTWVEAWYAAFDRVPDEVVSTRIGKDAKAAIKHKIASRLGRKRLYNRIRWCAAACAILALGLLITHLERWSPMAQNNDIVITSQAGERRPVLLGDSTIVWLNGKSRLRYRSNYGARDRKVWLEYGEAFLDVKPNADMPFSVHAQALQINVMGTAFNVDIADGGDIVVGVRDGKVQVVNGSEELGILRPGEELEFWPARMQYRLSNTAADRIAIWQLDKLELTNVDFNTLCRAVSDFYGIPVQVAGADNGPHRFTITLDRTVSIEGTLEIIAAIHQIEYAKAVDGTITIITTTP